MRKTLTALLSLTLIIIFPIQGAPVQADEPGVILTPDDLVGKWNGTLTIDYVEGDIDPEWVEYNRYLENYQVQIQGGTDGYWFAGGWRTAHDLSLKPDGSFSAKREYISNFDGSLIETFIVDGTVTNRGGQLSMNCRMEDVQYQSRQGNASKLIMTFNGAKEGTLIVTSSPTVTPEEPVNLGTGQEKGRITLAKGEVYIERDGKLIDATTGEQLMAGDMLIIGEDSEMTIEAETGGTLKLIENMRFKLPEEEQKVKIDSDSLSAKIENIWTRTKEFLSGESFEVKECTATAGVRG